MAGLLDIRLARQGKDLLQVVAFLERQQLLEPTSNSYLASAASEDSMQTLLGHYITYGIAVGPQAGRKDGTRIATVKRSDAAACKDAGIECRRAAFGVQPSRLATLNARKRSNRDNS